MFEPRPSFSLRLALGVVLALLVGVAGACGGSSSSKVSTTTSTTSANAAGVGGGATGFAAFRACLKQHGVDLGSQTGGPSGSLPSGGAPPSGAVPGGGGFPGGGSGGTPNSLPKGVTQSQFAAAQKACASKQPSGGFGGPGGGQAANAAYVSCLRDHGVTIPGGSSQTTAAGATASQPSFNPSDPKFAAANKVCQVLLQNSSTTTSAG